MIMASLHCECCDSDTCIQLAVAVESLRCYLLDPADDPRDPGVHSREGGIRAPVTIGHHPDLCVPEMLLIVLVIMLLAVDGTSLCPN